MITKKLLIILMTISLFNGCKSKTNENINMKNNQDTSVTMLKIEYIIPQELKKDSASIIECYVSLTDWMKNYDDSSDDVDPIIKDKDILIGAKVKNSLLKKRNLHFISDSIFKKRIEYIFGFNLDENKENIYSTPNYTIYSMQRGSESCEYITMFPDAFFNIERKNYFFFKDYRFFISGLPLLIGSTKQSENNNTIEFVVWDFEYHENNYVLNDSKSSLTWLINNNYDFLEDLVKEFGYDKEPQINKAILNKAVKEYYSTQPYDKEVLKNLFVRRSCNNKLEIRNGLFKSIIENTTSDNKELYDMLNDHILDLISDNKPFLKLTIAEKAELFAYFASMETEIFDRYRVPSWPYHTLTYGILNNSTDDYRKIWEENNYYNIPNFNHILESLDLENEPLP